MDYGNANNNIEEDDSLEAWIGSYPEGGMEEDDVVDSLINGSLHYPPANASTGGDTGAIASPGVSVPARAPTPVLASAIAPMPAASPRPTPGPPQVPQVPWFKAPRTAVPSTGFPPEIPVPSPAQASMLLNKLQKKGRK
jgi:hypothetical protein